jgi:glutamate carboxypeptidase
MKSIRSIFAILLLAAGLAQAADQKLLGAARAAEPAVIQTLKELVAIESGSGNVAGLEKMAAYAEQRLKALGARTERLKVARGPGAPILKASFAGTGRAKILLLAHMDTVYQEGILATQPQKQEGNRLYGPGIADDKGGIAVILHSLEILKAAGWRDYAQLTVLLNPDEEIGSIGSGDLIAQVASEHDVVLSCEPTVAKAIAKQEGLLLGAAGTGLVTMEVLGKASHAGAAPDQGRNALVELSHQLLQTRDVAKGVPGTQLNWTSSSAGLVRNQIPEKAAAYGDMRLFVNNRDADALLAALRAKVAESRLVPDTQVTITMTVNRPPYAADERAKALAKKAQAIYAELDGRPLALVPGTGGGTDAGFASLSGKAVVLESFGLAGWGYHARDEYIEIDSIVPRLYLMTRMLVDLGKN